MKKTTIFMAFVLLLNLSVFSSAADFAGLDIKVGYISIPRPFIHAGKDYEKSVYYVTLTAKEGVPYFNFHNRKKELLFEEMAVVKPNKSRGKFNFRIRKGFLAKHEYFRLKVIRPDAVIMAFLLVKQKEAAPPQEAEGK